MTEVTLKISCLGDVKTIAESLRATHVEWLADQIEEQVKPAIEEPQEFGSVVRAGYPSQPPYSASPLWQRTPVNGKHYWESEYGVVEVWSELTDVEVLRVGLSEQNAEEKAFADGYSEGCKETNALIRSRLVDDVLPLAIANERRIGVEKAIQAVEELAP